MSTPGHSALARQAGGNGWIGNAYRWMMQAYQNAKPYIGPALDIAKILGPMLMDEQGETLIDVQLARS